jgi:tRNA (mo5U34)-methyltransferase
MDASDLKSEVAKFSWFHRIDLGGGVVTPGIDDSPAKLRRLALPDDLKGVRVLDIGAADGFFSFEAERRGADRVLALDCYYSTGVGGEIKTRFEFARKVLNSRVEHMDLDVLDISPATIGSFDLVLFLGVLYHARHPLLALERVFSVTKRQLILETHVDQIWSRRPLMVFYPGNELNNDSTNWWGPNPSAVEAMLGSVGFRTVKKVGLTRSLPRRVGSALKLGITRKVPLSYTVQQNRAIFHAWR